MMQELDARTMAGVNRPFPLYWVTTSDGKWADIAPMATLTGLTHSPVRLMMAISPKRKTFRNIEKTRELVVNIPYGDERTLDAAWDSAWGGFAEGEDKFEVLGIETAPSKAVQPPRLANCIASIEYRLLEFLKPSPATGVDRPIMVLEPVACAADDACYDASTGRYREGTPVPLHYGGNVFGVLGKRILAGPELRASGRVLGGKEYHAYIGSGDRTFASKGLLARVDAYRARAKD
jgi:flavin reductase (DIM6/NTAB) family NADH-FMN oxidoreductase RutF